MNTKITLLSFATGALLAQGAAMAQPAAGSWETTYSAGLEGIPRETLHEPDTVQLANLGTIDPVFAGDPATLTLNRLAFRDALRPGPQFGIEAAYGMSTQFEPFVRLDYAQLRGKSREIGGVSSASLPTSTAISADFRNRDAPSLALGGRYFFTDSGSLHPYMTGFVGLTHEDALRANLEALGVGLASEPAVLQPTATKFDAGVEAGLSYMLNDRADFRLAAGADYLAGGRRSTSAFERFGLGPVELGAPHWSIPVSVGLTYRF